MQTPTVIQLVAMAVTVILGIVSLWARAKIALPKPEEEAYAVAKRQRGRYATLALICLLLFASMVLGLLQPAEEGAPVIGRVSILGLSVAESVVQAWIILVILAVLAVLARAFVIPRFRETPQGVQNALEASVGATEKAAGKLVRTGRKLAAFVMRHKRFFYIALIVLVIWVVLGLAMGPFMTAGKTLEVSISPPRMQLFGFDVSTTVVAAWIVIAALIVAAAALRIFVIPKFKETPRGLQNVLEYAVGEVSNFTKERFGHKNDGLASYFFALAALFIGSAVIEMCGIRPPTADIEMTFSYGLITFVLINYFGIRKKGLRGRMKSYLQPSPLAAPFKLISDLVIPVSLACRLFGNMLGGMIVVDLLYMSLGAFSVGIPAVLGLYFNAFHPLIQFFIFINLSLTFIGEAAE